MAASTVAYSDTTGNKDYLGMIAGQIGRRLKDASDMASNERAYAEEKAEEGGTSLSEAGIGKGYFFRRALGSRFGGDAIARTKGRMGMGGAGTDPTGNVRSRFRGGFDYNVTNEIQTATAPLSGAVVAGLRSVEGGLTQVAQSITKIDTTLSGLARTQIDMAKAIMFNGYLFQMFMSQQNRYKERKSARSEERLLEGGRSGGGGRIGGASFGGAGGGRGMVNITPGGSGGTRKSGGSNPFNAVASFGTSQAIGTTATTKAVQTGAKALESFSTSTPLAKTSSKTMAQILAGNSDEIAKNVAAKTGAKPSVANALNQFFETAFPQLSKNPKVAQKTAEAATTSLTAAAKISSNPISQIMLSKGVFSKGYGTANISNLNDAIATFSSGQKEIARQGINLKNMDDVARSRTFAENITKSRGINKKTGLPLEGIMHGEDVIDMQMKFGDDAERLIGLGFSNPKSRIIQQISKKFPGVKFADPMQAVAVTEIANRVDKGMDVVDAVDDVRKIYGPTIDNAISSASKLIPEKSKLAAALAKSAGKTASKGVLKSVLKQIPVVAGVAGVIFGIQRALEGDLMGAGLEITSGLLGATGTTPGIGLAIDGYLLGRDLGALPRNDGGLIPGGGPNKDTVPTLLTRGEYVMNRDATNRIGVPTLNAMNDNQYFAKTFSNPSNTNDMANMLNDTSAQTGMGSLMMPTTIITNNYAAVNGGGDSGDSGDSSFPPSFQAFTVPYSLASK